MKIFSTNYINTKNQYKCKKNINNIQFRGTVPIEKTGRQLIPNDYKIAFSSEQIQAKVKELANWLNQFYGNQEVHVIPILSGAMYFACDLTKEMNMPVKISNVILSSYGDDNKSSEKVKFEYQHLPDLSDKHVLIVDDAVATGYTTKSLKDYIKSHYDTKSIKVCVLFNQQSYRKVDFEPDFWGFQTDKFLYGYGFDDKGFSRNLKDVYYKEQE